MLEKKGWEKPAIKGGKIQILNKTLQSFLNANFQTMKRICSIKINYDLRALSNKYIHIFQNYSIYFYNLLLLLYAPVSFNLGSL